MLKTEHSDYNIAKLAQEVLDGMDISEVLDYVKHELVEVYTDDPELFETHWQANFSEE